MFKKYLSIVFANSLMVGSFHAEEPQQPHNRERSTIAYIVPAFFALFTGWSAWSSRNNLVGRVLQDADGQRLDGADLFKWLDAVEKGDTKAVTLAGAKLGDICTYTIENKLVPFHTTTDYKIMLGIAGALGLYALYSAYKLCTADSEKAA